MRAIIEKLQPDVMTFQELDHFADCSADLRALGYGGVRQPAGGYKSCHAAGVEHAPARYVRPRCGSLAFAQDDSNTIRFRSSAATTTPTTMAWHLWRASAFGVQPVLPRVQRRKALPGRGARQARAQEDSAPLFMYHAPRC